MSRALKAGFAVLTLVSASVLISACGGGGDNGGGGGVGKSGGIIKVAHTAYPDFLDPALSYTVDGWEPLVQVYPGLLVFPHVDGPDAAKPVPGLAEDMPDVSADGKTYKLKLRKNLEFSDGTPIRASDFKASIERVLATDSQGVGLGYTNIVGGEEYLKTKKGGVKGIEVNDQTGDITIKLVKPRGPFTYELAIPFSGIVPKDSPAKNLTKDPPPGAGRYVISDVEVNRSYKLRRNPNFSPALKGTAVDVGKPDGFDVKVVRSISNQVTQVAQNELDFIVDNPPADRIAEVKSKYADRYRLFPSTSMFYFFLNAEVKPFNNLKARQAVNYAIDPDAINRIQGGVIEPANETLPEGLPGYKDWPDLYPHDINKAKQLVEESGEKGTEVTVWGDPEDPTKPTVEYYADVLNQIGFKAKVKIVPSETYFTTVGDRSVHAQTGWMNWVMDYPHPADFIDVVVNPDKVVATGNTNYSYNAADKQLAKEINAAATKQLTPAVEEEWAQLDREIQEKAYWGVYGPRRQSTFFSERMDFDSCKGDAWPVATHDWARFCLK